MFVGMAGLGLQGVGLGLYSLGISTPIVGTLFGSGLTLTAAAAYASNWLWSSGSIGTVTKLLTNAATRARERVGNGSGHVYGTQVHSAFRQEVESLNRSDLWSEVSYKNQAVVRYGTKGSVRIDVVLGSPQNPTALFDLKTGSASLTQSRINEIRSHLPFGVHDIPIIEINP